MIHRCIKGPVSALVLFSVFAVSSATHGALPQLTTIPDDVGTRRGILVQLGCGDGARSQALCDSGRFVVQALDRDADRVERTREYLTSHGTYGPVSANVLSGQALPYIDNLVNVLVVDDAMGISRAEMLRVLCPRGLACIRNGDEWETLVKSRPATMDDWTHFLHDASGNAVSMDETVGPPRRLQWTGGPLWTRSHEFNNSMPAMVTANGRLFYIFDHGLPGMEDRRLPEKWTLTARDAFNGSFLWKRDMSSWGSRQWSSRALRFFQGNMARRLVADDDRVYVTFDYGKGVEVIDAETGKTLSTVPGTEGSEEILVDGNQLFCLSRIRQRRPGAHVRMTCHDLGENRQVWQVKDDRYIPQLTCIDGDAVVYHNAKQIVCLNRADGSVRWRVDEKYSAESKDDIMLLIADGRVVATSPNEIRVLSLDDGSIVWTAPGSAGESMRPYDLFVVQGQVFANSESRNIIAGYDLSTGEKTADIDPTSVQSQGHHLRCYRAKATQNFLITQFRGVEFLSLDDQMPHNQNDWLRGSCTYGVMPANGFLYQPPHSCFCFAGAMQKGFNAFAGPLQAAGEVEPFTDSPGPVEKGPAYGFIGKSTADGKAWNSYRHDARRTGATGNCVKGDLGRRWSVGVGTDITPPVAADARVFVAARSRHTIHAFNGDDGAEQWSFVAGGPIDSPPSIHRELLVFGCADGYAYCVRADNGELAWRRRLAPAERWMTDNGRLESVWRLHGSVAVVDDLAYCIAGRSSFVDGGLFLTAVDIETGGIRHRTNLYTASDEREDRKRNEFVASYHIEGAHSDLLVAQGGYIYLNQMRFSAELSPRDSEYLSKEQITERPSINLDNKAYVNEDIFKVKWENRVIDTYDKLAAILVDENQTVGERDTGLHMFTTSGFLDTSFFNRTYWMYSKTWPGFNMSNLAPKSGQLVVVGPRKTYALKAFTSRHTLSPRYNPQTKGYLLIADDNNNEPTMDPRAWGKDKGMGFSRGAPPIWHHWVPVRVNAMVLGGDQLIVCGPPDVLKENDPLAAFEGRLGSELWTLSARDGNIISQAKLEEMPVFDGMIVADDRLYLCTTTGNLICLGEE